MLRLITIMVWLLAVSSSLCGNVLAQKVEIRFRAPSLSTTVNLVRIQDVADVTGGEPMIRHQIGKLDIDEFSAHQTSLELTAETIRYRVLLAGISDAKFHIDPHASTTVTHWHPAKINHLIEEAIHGQLSDMYQLPREDIELKLVTQLEAAVLRGGLDLVALNIAARLPTELPLGKRNIALTISDGAGKSLNLNAVCEISVFREVAMVVTAVGKGDRLTDSNLERVRRPVNNAQFSLASYDQAIGKVVQSPLQPFSVVNQQALQNARATPKQPAVKRNSVLNVIYRQGGLVVTLKNVRANENGLIGDTISFVNPATKKTIYAKILDSNTALIER